MTSQFLIPLRESGLIVDDVPPCFERVGLQRSSPNQLAMPQDWWIYRYLILTAEQQKRLLPNAKMECGTVVGVAAQRVLLGECGLQDAADFAVAEMKRYIPRDDDADREQRDQAVKVIADMVVNVHAAINSVYKNVVSVERELMWRWTGLYLPSLGYSDIETKTHVIEIKTKQPRRGKVSQKTGQRVFSAGTLPATPDKNHVAQVSCYALATGKKPVLVYANQKTHQIFAEGNCAALEEKNLQTNVRNYYLTARARERLVTTTGGDVRAMVAMTQPDFSDFRWDLPTDLFRDAIELWQSPDLR